MSIARSLTIILACIAGFGTAGGLLGFALAVGAPGYYRAVFEHGNRAEFNPLQVGTGLGITQGVGAGFVVGLIAVLAVALSGKPRDKDELIVETGPNAGTILARSGPVRRTLSCSVFIASIITATLCGGAIGSVLGTILEQVRQWQTTSSAKLAKINPVLQEKPFESLSAVASSDGIVYVNGKVLSSETYQLLEERMRFLFGDEEAKRLVHGVEIVKD